MSKQGKPRVQKMGSIVNQLLARRGYGQIESNSGLHASVSSAVGPHLGAAISVGKLKSGVLFLYVTDSVMLQELGFRKRDVLKRLQADHPDAGIQDLRFRIQSSS